MAVKLKMELKNIRTVINSLNMKSKKVQRKTGRGLLKAGFLVQRKSQKQVPVDTGALKASATTSSLQGTATRPKVIVSYNTAYAIFVHENMQARHGPARLPFTRNGKLIGPGGKGQKAKFLEDAVKENIDEILRIIRREIQI